MTLIVGIRCEDGIVLGADGVATLGTAGQMTVRQQVKKLTRIADSVVIGTSGPVGLGQRFAATMQEIWETKKLSNKRPHEAMNILRSAFWLHAELEFNVAKTTIGVLGQQALIAAMSSTVVALPINKEPCLIQFDHQCAPELATGDLPFIAVGSGQPLADTFLAFIRRIFWPDRPPRINDGVLAAIWSLAQAIRTNPGGVGDPIQIMTLEKSTSNDWKVRELGEADFGEHRQAIISAENSLKNFKETLTGSMAVELPPTPN